MTSYTGLLLNDAWSEERMLAEQQELLRAGIWVWDILKDECHVSTTAREIFGLKGECPGFSLEALLSRVHPEDREAADAVRRKALETGGTYSLCYRLIREGGAVLQIGARGRATLDADQMPLRLVETVEDRTNESTPSGLRQASFGGEGTGRSDFEFTLLHLLQVLAGAVPEDGGVIERALGIVGGYCGADRVTIYRYNHESRLAQHLYEWDRKDTYYAGDTCAAIPFDKMEEALLSLACGAVYHYVREKREPIRFDEVTAQSGCESGYVFPILKNGRLYASVGLACTQNRDFPLHLSAIVHIFTEMVSCVLERMENSELLKTKNELAMEVEALNILHGLHVSLNRKNQVESLCGDILKAAVAFVHTEMGSIHLFDEGGNRLNLMHACGLADSFRDRISVLDPDDCVCGLSLKEKKRVIAEDLVKNGQYLGIGTVRFKTEEGIACEQSTPLIASSGKPVGVFNTYHLTNQAFDERALRMLDMLACLAADAIERAQTQHALLQSEKQALALVHKLQQEDKSKNEFLGALSHELRNPLATIVAGLSVLAESAGGREGDDVREIIRRQVDHLCRLVDDLLDMTRINTNKIRLQKEAIDLNKLVNGAGADYRPLFDKKGVALHMETGSQPICLDADPYRLNQCVGNLLSNALKFTAAGGVTRLMAFVEGSEAVIQVRDNGIGISQEFITHIFEPFRQEHVTLERANGGLGLGLSIVKGIAALHGGTVSVQSGGPGTGAAFTMRLPCLSADPDRCECVKAPPNRGGCLRILLIDDNRDFVNIVFTVLKNMGHFVMTAYDGREGIHKAKEYRPDVVFCDIGLPLLNGYDVAKALRKEESLKQTRLIALTGYAGSREAEWALQAGYDHHIAKPVDLSVIKKCLEGYGA